MTGKDFLRLQEGAEVQMDGKLYTMLDRHRTQMQLQRQVFYIDVWDFEDEEFDDEEAAGSYLSQLIDNKKEELKELREDLPLIADEYLDDHQEEIDEAERILDELEYADIEKREFGTPFCIDYRDVKEESDEDIILN